MVRAQAFVPSGAPVATETWKTEPIQGNGVPPTPITALHGSGLRCRLHALIIAPRPQRACQSRRCGRQSMTAPGFDGRAPARIDVMPA